MKYTIEFELPDNETVLNEIATASVAWSVWGYSGTAKPERRWIPCSETTPPEMGEYELAWRHWIGDWDEYE